MSIKYLSDAYVAALREAGDALEKAYNSDVPESSMSGESWEALARFAVAPGEVKGFMDNAEIVLALRSVGLVFGVSRESEIDATVDSRNLFTRVIEYQMARHLSRAVLEEALRDNPERRQQLQEIIEGRQQAATALLLRYLEATLEVVRKSPSEVFDEYGSKAMALHPHVTMTLRETLSGKRNQAEPAPDISHVTPAIAAALGRAKGCSCASCASFARMLEGEIGVKEYVASSIAHCADMGEQGEALGQRFVRVLAFLSDNADQFPRGLQDAIQVLEDHGYRAEYSKKQWSITPMLPN